MAGQEMERTVMEGKGGGIETDYIGAEDPRPERSHPA
jgi:hypothetical protein